MFAQVAESGPCSTQRQLARKRVAAHALVAVCPKEEVEHAWMDDVLQEEERTRDSKLLSEHKALATKTAIVGNEQAQPRLLEMSLNGDRQIYPAQILD